MKRTFRFLTALLVLLTTGSNVMWAQTGKSITYLWYVGGTSPFTEAYDNATKITPESDHISGWYYVEGDVTIDRTLYVSDDTNLILCDGAELTINSSDRDGIFLYSNLTIYAQSSGTHAGKLTINSSGNSGIIGVGDVTINGGIINILSGSTWGIDCYNFTVNGGKLFVTGNLEGIISDGHDVTINGGQVYVTVNGDGIDTTDGHDVTINGGKVSATGGDIGIGSDGAINLGWTNAEDYIEVSKYNKLPTAVGSKVFDISTGGTFGGGAVVDLTSLNGKKLTPNTTDPIYTVSLGAGLSSDNVEFDKAKAFEGERVAVTVTPPTGKILASLTYNDGTNDYALTRQANDYVITMPTHDVTVTATFVTPVAQIGDTKYATLAAALAAVGENETITMLDDKDESAISHDFYSASNKGVPFTLDLNGKTVSFGGILNRTGGGMYIKNGTFSCGQLDVMGDFTIEDATVTIGFLYDVSDNNEDYTLKLKNATVTCKNATEGNGSIQWLANNIKLETNSSLSLWYEAFIGNTGFNLSIDESSELNLERCKIGSYDSDRIYNQMLPYVRADKKAYFNTNWPYGPKDDDDNYIGLTLTLRQYNGLLLTSDLGVFADVIFYDGGNTEPDASTFDPTPYPKDGAGITMIDNSGDLAADKDRYIIVYIDPYDNPINSSDAYWTDESLLFGMETAGSLARTRNSGIDISQAQHLHLLKRDTYTDSESNTYDCYDGSGWYYYKLPKEHNQAAGYDYSTLKGYVPKRFDLNYSIWNGTHVSQNGNIVTVTNDEGWTAILTFDAVSFKFTGNEIAPTIESLVIKKDETEIFNLTTPNQIAQQLELSGYQTIDDKHCPYLTARGYSWFTNYDWIVIKYAITVPFDGSGIVTDEIDDPWQIKTAKDLDLLAKCVNVGDYDFNGEYLKQINEIDMGDIDDFLPIGAVEYLPFRGWYNGDNKPISNLTVDISVLTTDDENIMYSDVSDFVPVGLFGFVGGGIVENVILSNSSISYNSDMLSGAVGGIVGKILPESAVSNSTVINTTITATGKDVWMGGIAGLIDVLSFTPIGARAGSKTIKRSDTPTNTIEDCTVDACTISNKMTDGVETSDYIDINWTGGIVGMAVGGSLSGNRVTGATKITSDINLDVDCPLGAIFGEITSLTPTSPVTTLSDNKYVKAVELIKKKATGTTDAATITANGYTKRGYWNWDATPEAWDDINDATEGAMMEVYPATLRLNEITGYSPSLEIDVDNPNTPAVETLDAGTNCYEIVAETESSPAKYYFAPGDNITLAVSNTTLTRTDDGRTFHADLSLTMNDNDLTVTDGKATFTMPSSAATVAATYTEANWFTVPSNGKKWMSFYHEWTNGPDILANYTVSDGTEGASTLKTIKVSTITDINTTSGAITQKDLNGTSFSGTPTLFNCDDNLPALLRFDPVANAVTNVVAPTDVANQFKGTATTKTEDDLTDAFIYIMNGDGDFILAADKSAGLGAHRCYIGLSTALTARLHFVGEADGIDSATLNDHEQMMNDKWYSIDGRNLNGIPTKKGIYIYKGKKVVIK